jgi:EAL domain-containing protein (putative c-di-GMP-specific phosphodiesterase class I)
LRVGAEGILCLEQLECLRQLGCYEGQGPLIARPRPLDELVLMIHKEALLVIRAPQSARAQMRLGLRVGSSR